MWLFYLTPHRFSAYYMHNKGRHNASKHSDFSKPDNCSSQRKIFPHLQFSQGLSWQHSDSHHRSWQNQIRVSGKYLKNERICGYLFLQFVRTLINGETLKMGGVFQKESQLKSSPINFFFFFQEQSFENFVDHCLSRPLITGESCLQSFT